MFLHNVDGMEGDYKGEEHLETEKRLCAGEEGEKIEGGCNYNDAITEDKILCDVEEHTMNANDNELDIRQKAAV